MIDFKCKTKNCTAPLVAFTGVQQTLVGYFQEEGHNHNDNCRAYIMVCAEGHESGYAIRNECPNPTCGWRGKESCSICAYAGDKLDKSEVVDFASTLSREPPQKWLDAHPWYKKKEAPDGR